MPNFLKNVREQLRVHIPAKFQARLAEVKIDGISKRLSLPFSIEDALLRRLRTFDALPMFIKNEKLFLRAGNRNIPLNDVYPFQPIFKHPKNNWIVPSAMISVDDIPKKEGAFLILYGRHNDEMFVFKYGNNGNPKWSTQVESTIQPNVKQNWAAICDVVSTKNCLCIFYSNAELTRICQVSRLDGKLLMNFEVRTATHND